MLLSEAVDAIAAETEFAGVVSVDHDGEIEFARAYGLARRANQVPNTTDTRFAIASGVKGLTALTVVSLIERDALRLSTTARSLLGTDLPLIGADVTVEQLLAHRSGIGDHVDEEAGHDITDYTLTVPAQELATTEQYLAVLAGIRPSSRRASGSPTATRVCGPGPDRRTGQRSAVRRPAAGPRRHPRWHARHRVPALRRTARAHRDRLPADRGPVQDERVPPAGSGQRRRRIYSTAADISAFWRSLFAERIVSAPWVAEMVQPRSDVPAEQKRYGLGFWLHPTADIVMLEGYDAGVSFRTVHDPASHLTHTVISNSSDGAWPITARLDELLGT